jgi:putative ABC transport system permease protein
MTTLINDIKYAIRQFMKYPGFTAVVVLTMALGVGAFTAIFSVVNAVLLRPMHFSDAQRLVMVWEGDSKKPDEFGSIKLLRFLDWKNQSTTLEQMAFFTPGWKSTLTSIDEAIQLTDSQVSPEFFATLGMKPILGRTFTSVEASVSGPTVVILNHEIWQRYFSGNPDILGKNVTLDAKVCTVVGVMPAGFKFPEKIDLWTPFCMDADSIAPVGPGTGRGEHGAWMIGKLKKGVTHEQVQVELETIAKRRTQFPFFGDERAVRLTSLHEHLVKNSRLLLYVFQSASLLVLLLASANVANLLLARMSFRTKEMAIRLSLGAGRLRMLRQLLTESSILVVLGGGSGFLLAYGGVKTLHTLAASFVPRMEEVSLDGRVLTMMFLVSLMIGLIFALTQLLRATKINLNECLKESGTRRSPAGSRRDITRHSLVVAEISLSLMLLIGAGLLLKSFVLLSNVRLGFNPENLLVVKMVGAGKALLEPTGQELIERLSSLPGVQAMGAANDLPPDISGTWFDMSIEDGPTNKVFRQTITPDYFRAMSIKLIKGRGITEQDIEGSLPVVVVNEAFVKHCSTGIDPIGKQLVTHPPNIAYQQRNLIVGIVKDFCNQKLQNHIQPEAYYSYRQNAFSAENLILRTESDPTQLAPSIRKVIGSIEKDRPILSIETMEQRLAESIMPEGFRTTLLTLFSIIGLVLATVGIYGLVSYSVAQRVREFGIRMAVGARRVNILQLVVRQALRLVVLGIGLGLCGVLALTRVLKSFLFQVEIMDPITIIGVSIFLGSVTLLASYIPARRAAKIDPMEALRYE